MAWRYFQGSRAGLSTAARFTSAAQTFAERVCVTVRARGRLMPTGFTIGSMAFVKATPVLSYVLMCPECGKGNFSWGHLKPGQAFGPWYCDECGVGITGKAEADGADVEIRQGERRENRLALLELKSEEPVYVLIDASRVRGANETEEETNHHDRYFYDEHTCPTNWLDNVVEVFHGSEPDPHGLFRFVRSAPGSVEQFGEHARLALSNSKF